MTPRENFLAVLAGEQPETFPLMEFMGYWPETERRWRAEAGIATATLEEHFDLLKRSDVFIDFNFVPSFEERVLEETATHMVLVDAQGCTKKIEKDSSAMPHYLAFPIQGRADFEALRERLDPTSPERYPADWEARVAAWRGRDCPLGLFIRGPFAFCRDFINFEQFMLMVYDEPELVREMMTFQVDFIVALWERALRDVDVDYVYLGEDMAYKTAPMLSPALCRELLMPLYQRLTDFFRAHGVPNIILDSDGCVLELLEMMVTAGITCTLPLEQAAGMDVGRIREQFPRLGLIGGIDKLRIAAGPDGIATEIAKVRRLVGRGGWIPACDHSVPPVVSYENYRHYLNQLRAATASA